jgi:hypothetical protein
MAYWKLKGSRRQCRGDEVPSLDEYGPIRQPHTLRSDLQIGLG